MFSSGVGSQVMHVSVSSPAKEMLFDESRKYLDDKHLCTVKARLGEVRVECSLGAQSSLSTLLCVDLCAPPISYACGKYVCFCGEG